MSQSNYRGRSAILYKNNPYLRISLGPPVRCTFLHDGAEFEFGDPRLIGLLAGIRRPSSYDTLVALCTCALRSDRPTAEAVVSALVEAGVVIEEGTSLPQPHPANDWIRMGWGEALAFHHKTRNVACADDSVAASSLAPAFDKELECGRVPTIWREYPGHIRHNLPPPVPHPAHTRLAEVLRSRRSGRPWRGGMTGQELSRILLEANRESLILRRRTESALGNDPSVLMESAFCALETYLIVNDVPGLSPGLYHYDMRGHLVVGLKAGHFDDDLVRGSIGQAEACGSASRIYNHMCVVSLHVPLQAPPGLPDAHDRCRGVCPQVRPPRHRPFTQRLPDAGSPR